MTSLLLWRIGRIRVNYRNGERPRVRRTVLRAILEHATEDFRK